MQSTRRHLWRRAAPLGLLTTLLLTACADNAPQDTFEPEGRFTRKIEDLATPFFAIAIGIGVIVYALVFFCVVKFRRKGDDHVPKQVHGNTAGEIAWTVGPAILLGVMGVMSIGAIFELDEDPENSYEIAVIGHQWWWEYRYPAPGESKLDNFRLEPKRDEDGKITDVYSPTLDGDYVVTANELRIPAGRNVRLHITSADVIHSYWIPKLSGKIDAVPARINGLSMHADRAGRYLGQCAEFCGTSHANMRQIGIALDPDDFDAWIASEAAAAKEPAADTLEAQGKALFEGTGGCAACHWVDATKPNDQVIDPKEHTITGHIGPNLAHVGNRTTFAGAAETFDERDLRAWLRDPQKVKPGNRMVIRDLTEDEITQLIAYLKSLK